MNVNFDNIYEHIISINDSHLKWRFTEDKFNKLPNEHLHQVNPLDKAASRFLWEFIMQTNLHDDIPFKKGLFRVTDKARILDNNRDEVKKWLYQRGFAFDKPVFLSWQPTEAAIIPWKILVKYFDSFYYGSADDLTVIDQSLNWSLLFYHEDEIYFGTNTKYVASKTFEDTDFIW
ncbi:hypothetical protein [Hymenobacter ruricola]|nr:hypothetical protein [Hymenobacter ruricola]